MIQVQYECFIAKVDENSKNKIQWVESYSRKLYDYYIDSLDSEYNDTEWMKISE